MTVKPIPLQKISDDRGTLVVLQQGNHLPFAAKRSYFIYGTQPDQPRGFHAHKTLDQVFVCVQGACDLTLEDNEGKYTLRMDSPAQAVRVGPMVWHEMHNFTNDCIFLAYASDVYDEADYIRDYNTFKKLVA